MAFMEMPPVGLRGHIMSISGRFTGIGMEGTRPFAEQAESLRPGDFRDGPFKLAEDSPLGVRAEVAVVPCGTSGEDDETAEAEEEDELCLCGCLAGSSLMVTVLPDLDLDMVNCHS